MENISQLPSLVENALSNRRLESYYGYIDAKTSLALAVIDNSCFVWGFGRNANIPCRRFRPNFGDECLSLHASIVQFPRTEKAYALVIASNDGVVAIWEDVLNTPPDMFYETNINFKSGSDEQIFDAKPLNSGLDCLIVSNRAVYLFRVFDGSGSLLCNYKTLEKPSSVVSQVTQLFGYSVASIERSIEAFCLDDRDNLYLSNGDHLEIWQLHQDRALGYKCLRSSKLKSVISFDVREDVAHESKLTVSEMSFHEKNEALLVVCSTEDYEKTFLATLRVKSQGISVVQIKELTCHKTFADSIVTSVSPADYNWYILASGNQLRIISSVLRIDSEEYCIDFRYFLAVKEVSDQVLVLTTAGLMKLNLEFISREREYIASGSAKKVPAEKIRTSLEKCIFEKKALGSVLEIGNDLDEAMVSLSKDILNSRIKYFAAYNSDIKSMMEEKVKRMEDLSLCIDDLMKNISKESRLMVFKNIELCVAGASLWRILNQHLRILEQENTLNSGFSSYPVTMLEFFLRERNILLQDHLRSLFRHNLSLIPDFLLYCFEDFKNKHFYQRDKSSALKLSQLLEMHLVIFESIQRYHDAAWERYFGQEKELDLDFFNLGFANNLNQLFEYGNKELESLITAEGFKRENLSFRSGDEQLVVPGMTDFIPFLGTQLLRIAKVLLVINNVISDSAETKTTSPNLILAIFKMGFEKESIFLAETFRVFSSLIKLIYQSEKDPLQRLSVLDYYSRTYERNFAFDLFEYMMEKGYILDLLDCSDSLAVYLGDFLEQKELYGYLWTQTLQVGDFDRCYKSCRRCAMQTDDLMLKKFSLSMAKLSAAMIGQVPASIDEHLYLSSLQEDLFETLAQNTNFPVVFEGANAYLEPCLEKLHRKIVLNEIELFDILTLLEFPYDFDARIKAYRVCTMIESEKSRNILVRSLWRRLFLSLMSALSIESFSKASDEKRMELIASTNYRQFLDAAKVIGMKKISKISDCYLEGDDKLWIRTNPSLSEALTKHLALEMAQFQLLIDNEEMSCFILSFQ